MRALPSLLHVLVTFAALTSTCGAGAEEDTNSVGTVNKVENEAHVISAPGAITAAVGTPGACEGRAAPRRQRPASGYLPRPRQHPTLREHTSAVIDRYVFDPDRSVGEMVLQATARSALPPVASSR